MAKRKTSEPRSCAVCGKPGPAEGPLPYEWDSHLVKASGTSGKHVSAMYVTCSAKCRVKAGLRERKGVA